MGMPASMKMTNREAVQQVYSFSNLMNRMATERKVKRKLHIWVGPALEQRFFALKSLKYTIREARERAGNKIHTRVVYKDRTI